MSDEAEFERRLSDSEAESEVAAMRDSDDSDYDRSPVQHRVSFVPRSSLSDETIPGSPDDSAYGGPGTGTRRRLWGAQSYRPTQTSTFEGARLASAAEVAKAVPFDFWPPIGSADGRMIARKWKHDERKTVSEIVTHTPKYNGGPDVDIWLQRVLRDFCNQGIHPDAACRELPKMMEGAAYKWATSENFMALRKWTWDTMADKIRTTFQSRDAQTGRIAKYQNRIRGKDEDPVEFADACHTLRDNAFGTFTDTLQPDALLIAKVVDQLPPHLVREVSTWAFDTWSDFYGYLRKINGTYLDEAKLKPRSQAGGSNEVKQHYSSERREHSSGHQDRPPEPSGEQREQHGRYGRGRHHRNGGRGSDVPSQGSAGSNSKASDSAVPAEAAPVHKTYVATTATTQKQDNAEKPRKDENKDNKTRPPKYCPIHRVMGFPDTTHSALNQCEFLDTSKKWASDVQERLKSDKVQEQVTRIRAIVETNKKEKEQRRQARQTDAKVDANKQPTTKSNLIRLDVVRPKDSELAEVMAQRTERISEKHPALSYHGAGPPKQLSDSQRQRILSDILSFHAAMAEALVGCRLHAEYADQIAALYNASAHGRPTSVEDARCSMEYEQPARAEDVVRHMVVPKWNDLLKFRDLILETAKGHEWVLVIPRAAVKLFEDLRIDRLLHLPKSASMFDKQDMVSSADAAGLGQMDFSVVLAAGELAHAQAFRKHFGADPPASMESLRAGVHILRHNAFLPGYSDVRDEQRVLKLLGGRDDRPLRSRSASQTGAPVSFPPSKIPPPQAGAISTARHTPLHVDALIDTPRFGKLAHKIIVDSGSAVAILSQNMVGTLCEQKEVADFKANVDGANGEPVHVTGRVLLNFEIPDWRDSLVAPIRFGEFFYVSPDQKDMVLIGNQAVSRARIGVFTAAEPNVFWLVSDYEMTIAKAYGVAQRTLPLGRFHRVITPCGVKYRLGAKPAGYREPPDPDSQALERCALYTTSMVTQQEKARPQAEAETSKETSEVDITAEEERELRGMFELPAAMILDQADPLAAVLLDPANIHVDPRVGPRARSVLMCVFVKYRGAVSCKGNLIGTLRHVPPFEDHLAEPLIPARGQMTYGAKEAEKMRPLIQKMFDLGVIRNTLTAQFRCRVQVVSKPPPATSADDRLVVNYKPYNKAVKRDAYPVAHVGDNLRFLMDVDPETNQPRCSFMSDLDANKAYWQVLLKDEHTGDMMAFQHADGVVAPTRMPFGPANAPAHWSRVCDIIQGSDKWIYFTNFYDNIHCAGSTLRKGLIAVGRLFQRMQKHGMTVALAKVPFLLSEPDDPGHACNGGWYHSGR